MKHIDFETLEIEVKGLDIDSEAARALAESLAAKRIGKPFLVAWFDGVNNVEHPQVPECQHKPGWISYAEGHGGKIRVDVNRGLFSFIFSDEADVS